MFKIYQQYDRIICDPFLLERSWELSTATVYIESDNSVPYINTFWVKNNDVIAIAIKANEHNKNEIRIIPQDTNESITMNLDNNDVKSLIISEYSYSLRLSLQINYTLPIITMKYGSQIILQHYNNNKFDIIELEEYALLTLTKNSILNINNLKLSNSSIIELEPGAEMNIIYSGGCYLHLEAKSRILKIGDTLYNALHNMFLMGQCASKYITNLNDNIEVLSGDIVD